MKSERISKSAATSPETQPRNPQPGNAGRRKRRRKNRNNDLPLLPPPVVSRQGKTTIKRYSNRTFHRMEEVKGKTVDFVEFFTSNGYHVIDIGFEDKTALHLAIEPCFTLEREYADWKTGDSRSLKEWPLIRSRAIGRKHLPRRHGFQSSPRRHGDTEESKIKKSEGPQMNAD